MNKAECIAWVESHLEVKYATANGAYAAGRKISVVGALNHSVGCAQPSVDVFFSLMNKSSCGWGVNALIGDFHLGDGRILLTMPYDARPWGCGSGSKGSWNNSHIQWEVCEPAGHTYAGGTMIGYDVVKNQVYFDRMWKMLVAWNVFIAVKFGFSPDKIVDHAESNKAGYGSNHGDMGHWLPKHGKSMTALRNEVIAILNNTEEDNTVEAYDNFKKNMATYRNELRDNDKGTWSDEATKWAVENGLFAGNGSTIAGEPNFMWEDMLTREQAAQILYNFAKLMGKV